MRPVVGFDGLYSVTADGRVWSHRAGRFVGGYPNKDGYLCAVLTIDGKRLFTGIHRLVAVAWLGDRGTGFEPNHKNGIRSDNRVENLEWVTHRQNCLPDRSLNLMRTRRRGKENGACKFSESQIREVSKLRAAGMSQDAISTRTGISQPHISRILRRENWRHL